MRYILRFHTILRLQAVLVDRSGPVTVSAELDLTPNAGRAQTETPPAITPVKAGGPSHSNSNPTSPKGPGELMSRGLCRSRRY